MTVDSRNIKLIIEYDGTCFAGWQRQINALSVQEAIEDALLGITDQKTTITAAGRTDSGVHAKGQTANFYTSSKIPQEKFAFALNALLPSDVRVVHSAEVPLDFHARFSSVGKRYRYSIVTSQHGIAIGRQFYYHIPFPLDVDAMKRAASYLQGTHDFYGFMSVGSKVKNTLRTLREIKIEHDPPYLLIDFSGDGFLYNMVRILTGTLIEVGKGKIHPDDLPVIISSRDRNQAGPTAPPHGLCLMEVYY